MEDAEGLLERFLVDDEPDPTRFREVIGGLLRRAGDGGRPVYVYGEMVAVLWAAGRVNAALEVERLWNDLGCKLRFSLLCGYPALAVEPDQAGGRERVCGLHSGVIGAPPPRSSISPPRRLASRTFPEAWDSPQAARRFVVDVLQESEVGVGLVEDASLVVTELATNALLHAHSAASVTLAVDDAIVHLSVADAATALPILHLPGALDTSGRGLRMVAALSQHWGADLVNGGKVVWVELRR
jgi:hypothetical protein